MDEKIRSFYESFFLERRDLNNVLLTEIGFLNQIENAYLAIKKSIDGGGKIMIFGNGGSAAEAQHFAAELVCKFEKKRVALPAISLTTNTSTLTAQSNDVGFNTIFSRQIEALGNPGDIAVGLTTSDSFVDKELRYSHSMNIHNAFIAARKKKIKTVGLVSQKTHNVLLFIDHPIIIPHEDTDVIQEAHLSVIHLLCKRIEGSLNPVK